MTGRWSGAQGIWQVGWGGHGWRCLGLRPDTRWAVWLEHMMRWGRMGAGHMMGGGAWVRGPG